MKTLKLFLVTVLFAFLANSCNNPFAPPDIAKPGKLPAGKGSFSLRIAGAERTIMPENIAAFDKNAPYSYELIFTSSDGKEIRKTINSIIDTVILDIGTYSLVVNVYDDQKLLFIGTAENIEIKKDIPATADINLEPAASGGAGTFSWDITLPDSVSSAYMDIMPRGKETLVERIMLNNSEKTGARELTSGFYDVIITMTGRHDVYGDINVIRKEILHIYNDSESKYTNSFKDINFNIVYTVTFLNAAGEPVPVYVVHGAAIPDNYFNESYLAGNGYAPPSDAFLYKSAVPAEPGYTFGGWYLDGGFIEEWAEITPITNNITLYPKWNSAGNPIDVSGEGGNTNFEKIVNFINNITTTTNTNYTLFIVEDVTLTETLTINNGVNLTVTSANVNNPSTITANSGLFVVEGGLTLENIIIAGTESTDVISSLVQVFGGELVMNEGAVLQGHTNVRGVLVYIGQFTMNGGTIRSSVLTEAGGGVVVENGGTFTMTGGEIQNNAATGNGGGVYVSGTLVLGGTAVIKDNNKGGNNNNVYLTSGKFITLSTNPLQSPAEIWVQTASTNGVIVNSGATSGDARYFRSDVEGGYFIVEDFPFQLVLKTDLAFAPIGDTAYSVMDYTGTPMNPIDVIIPAWYNGKLVTEIGAGAFYDKQLIKTVTFAEGSQLTSIGGGAFRSCNGLTSITIPEGVTAINPYTFSTCTSLASISIPASVTSIGQGAFSGCSGLASITLPEGVISIGEEAFSDCTELTGIEIPASVKTIGDSAFFISEYDSDRFETVFFKEGSQLESIGERAFFYCTAIKYITIPASVKTIGNFAFNSCSLLEEVTLLAEYPPTLGQSVFSNASPNLMIIVPLGRGNTYRGTAGWSSYADKIVAEDDEEE